MTGCHNVLCAAVCFLVLNTAQAAADSGMRVYDSTELGFDRYTVLKRIWVNDWTSAFWIPGRQDATRARAAVLDEATRLGADAVVNLYCVNRSEEPFRWSGHTCYGNAVRLKQK